LTDGAGRHADGVNDDTDTMRTTGGDAPVQVFASDTVITVPNDATLRAAARALDDDQIGLVAVGSTDDVRGVISERDIARAVAQQRDPDTTLAGDVASAKVVWADSTATVGEVAELMMEHYVRHVLLEDDGHLVGIVSARDLLGAYVMTQ
jgi:CBS domain-containing protein